MKESTKAKAVKQGLKTIVLDISESDYSRFLTDLSYARKVIDQALATDHQEKLFPQGTAQVGYCFKGFDRVSQKQTWKLRRIAIAGQIYRIRPAFLLSYMRGRAEDVKWGLFILRFGVPFWAVALVFGKYPMYWYRLWLDLGRNSLVGTTIFSANELPQHLLGDEEHIRVQGSKALCCHNRC